MPALSRAVFLGLQAAALVSLVGPSFAPSPALATPIPLPVPMMPHIADYAAQPPARSNATTAPSSENVSLVGRQADVAVVSHTTSRGSTISSRDDMNTQILNNINVLGVMQSQMNQHSRVLKEIASRSASEGDNEDLRQQAVTEYTAYQDNLLGVQTILAQLGADKGLANYDRSDELETILKDIINLTKDTLKSVSIIVDNIPFLGPILGPIVYQIKCILDDVLDAVENLTDALLNALKPLLVILIGQATTAACNAGVALGSLCLVL